jgi:hypothetical protein
MKKINTIAKKIKVNSKVIKKLKPCEDRFDNWLHHYGTFDGSIIEFLSLDKISAMDKMWVASRLLPRDLMVTFAIDCAFSAYAAADAANADAADAANAATYVTAYVAADAANAAAFDAAYAFDAANAAASAVADVVFYTAYTAYNAYIAGGIYAAAASYTATHAAAAARAANTERERQIDALIYLVETWEDV